MGMTVKKVLDTRVARVFMHKIADVRGGVSVVVSELLRDFLPEGTPISAPDADGKCHVVKFAALTAAATNAATTYKIAKGSDFKVGDFITLGLSAKAYAITAISTSNSGYDELTVGTTLGVAAAIGDYVLQAAAEASGNTSVFAYAPFALTGTGKNVDSADNFTVDAWVIGVTKGNALPSAVSAALKGIINY